MRSAFGIDHGISKSMPIGLSGLPGEYVRSGAQAVKKAPKLARAAQAHARAGKAGRLRKIEDAGRAAGLRAQTTGATARESFARPTFGRKKQAAFDRAFHA